MSRESSSSSSSSSDGVNKQREESKSLSKEMLNLTTSDDKDTATVNAAIANAAQDDYKDEKASQKQFFSDTSKERMHDSNEGVEEGEDGNKILIERDGKFQMVDKKELKAEYMDLMGMTPRPQEEQSPTNPPSSSKRERKIETNELTTYKNPEYDHIKSRYGMTDQQKDMKRKREEAVLARQKEAEQKLKEEEHEKRKFAESCFDAWLTRKREETKEGQRLKKAAEQHEGDTEQNEMSEDAYQCWLKEKRTQHKQAKELEQVRLVEESHGYEVRDRSMCDKAFKLWLRRKNTDNQRKSMEWGQAVPKHPGPQRAATATVRRAIVPKSRTAASAKTRDKTRDYILIQ